MLRTIQSRAVENTDGKYAENRTMSFMNNKTDKWTDSQEISPEHQFAYKSLTEEILTQV